MRSLVRGSPGIWPTAARVLPDIMLFRIVLPLTFIFLWSSAFLAAKIGVLHSTPFAMLLIRFVLVSLVFAAIMLFARSWRQASEPRPGLFVVGLTALVGITLHCFYLGSVFFALSLGLSAGISALIVSLQPLLASGQPCPDDQAVRRILDLSLRLQGAWLSIALLVWALA